MVCNGLVQLEQFFINPQGLMGLPYDRESDIPKIGPQCVHLLPTK